ncbi:unnamed protein product [marine sediment metagenome]|uniref:Uncharacterized protein n=1 Tax=marine sediment metagenome TaxID=412755 RepID=X1L0D0_9ZZZZ
MDNKNIDTFPTSMPTIDCELCGAIMRRAHCDRCEEKYFLCEKCGASRNITIKKNKIILGPSIPKIVFKRGAFIKNRFLKKRFIN